MMTMKDFKLFILSFGLTTSKWFLSVLGSMALMLITCLWSLPVLAQDVGGSQSPFSLGGSARALGMGGADTALSGDGDSFFDNPSSLATLKQQEIMTFHAPIFIDTNYDAIGYVQVLGSHSSLGIFRRPLTTSSPFPLFPPRNGRDCLVMGLRLKRD